jgi:hypothetical protein
MLRSPCRQQNVIKLHKQYDTQKNKSFIVKEFLGSASVNMGITQQSRTPRFSACPPLTSHGTSKEGSRDLRSAVTHLQRVTSATVEKVVFPRDPTRGVNLEVNSDAKGCSRLFKFKLVLGWEFWVRRKWGKSSTCEDLKWDWKAFFVCNIWSDLKRQFLF